MPQLNMRDVHNITAATHKLNKAGETFVIHTTSMDPETRDFYSGTLAKIANKLHFLVKAMNHLNDNEVMMHGDDEDSEDSDSITHALNAIATECGSLALDLHSLALSMEKRGTLRYVQFIKTMRTNINDIKTTLANIVDNIKNYDLVSR